jgi:hypothetical protein
MISSARQQHRKTQHTVAQVLGRNQNAAEALFEGVAQLLADLGDLLFRNGFEAGAQDGPHLMQDLPVQGQNIVVNAADSQHALKLTVS